MALNIGDELPSFRLQNQDGKTVSGDDYRGKWLILYVYPKDDTPGCTVQARSFTQTREAFTSANAVVVGLSQDDVSSHRAFCDKFSLAVDLLSDPNQELLGALGGGQGEYKGMPFWKRTTFIVDPEGRVRKIYRDVNPDGHEKVLLADLESLKVS